MTDPTTFIHATRAQLDAALGDITRSPSEVGTVQLVVSRPAVDERQVISAGHLEAGSGLVGDNYIERGNPRTPDGLADPLAELTVMNSRVLATVAGPDHARWPAAGDQLIVDLDLSLSNLPAGTRLAIGSAVIEVTAKPHNGCAKFRERYGVDAARWVNSSDELRLRGINAVVVENGVVRPTDSIRKL